MPSPDIEDTFPLSEIVEKIENIMASIQTDPIGLKNYLLQIYTLKCLSTIDSIIKEKKPEERHKQLVAFFESNWSRVHGTMLAYTAQADTPLTHLFCDLVQYAAEYSNRNKNDPAPKALNKQALSFLMPTTFIKSIDDDDYSHLDDLPLKVILKTYVEGQQGLYLVPIKLLQEYATDSIGTPTLYNYYYDDSFKQYDNELGKGIIMHDEVKRLLCHSDETLALRDAKSTFDNVVAKAQNLFEQINLLMKTLYDYSIQGIGGEFSANRGANEAMLAFFHYHESLDSEAIDSMSSALKEAYLKEISIIKRCLLLEPPLPTPIERCCDQRQKHLNLILTDHAEELKSIGISSSLASSQRQAAKEKLTQQTNTLLTTIQEPTYHGQDHLPLTSALLNEFDITLEEYELEDFMDEVNATELRHILDDDVHQQMIFDKIENINDFYTLLGALPISKLEPFLEKLSSKSVQKFQFSANILKQILQSGEMIPPDKMMLFVKNIIPLIEPGTLEKLLTNLDFNVLSNLLSYLNTEQLETIFRTLDDTQITSLGVSLNEIAQNIELEKFKAILQGLKNNNGTDNQVIDRLFATFKSSNTSLFPSIREVFSKEEIGQIVRNVMLDSAERSSYFHRGLEKGVQFLFEHFNDDLFTVDNAKDVVFKCSHFLTPEQTELFLNKYGDELAQTYLNNFPLFLQETEGMSIPIKQKIFDQIKTLHLNADPITCIKMHDINTLIDTMKALKNKEMTSYLFNACYQAITPHIETVAELRKLHTELSATDRQTLISSLELDKCLSLISVIGDLAEFIDLIDDTLGVRLIGYIKGDISSMIHTVEDIHTLLLPVKQSQLRSVLIRVLKDDIVKLVTTPAEVEKILQVCDEENRKELENIVPTLFHKLTSSGEQYLKNKALYGLEVALKIEEIINDYDTFLAELDNQKLDTLTFTEIETLTEETEQEKMPSDNEENYLDWDDEKPPTTLLSIVFDDPRYTDEMKTSFQSRYQEVFPFSL